MNDRSDPSPDWYKDAVIYEVRVRSFMDGDGDGIGDLRGLTARLDYLQDLGVTALWLLPLFPSPGRDDGYDIADYHDIHPELGTLDDFRTFLDEAHRRGLKVITELVLNHTSDQHPWFQRARRAPPGSPERDFYVWSDTTERYRDTRIIFQDYEQSNWAWDPVAEAYYWHRFYSHQPDLNFDNPAVRTAMLEVLDLWFGMGVDGLRLDAVPYLFEREGTHCENLPETHAYLKELRAHVDARFPDRMLLAEANQWPEDAAAYFGDGDECHMNFHFPIMPRLYMAMHAEDRFPILDILDQTPELPEGAQWALFLRNHDELTLEMVTEEERDAMWKAYAHEPTMRLNLGIRRRLAPLLDNDRRSLELMNGLLCSLPGTPVLYYGDEIGMGDNVYLGDRNGVRTPMQWNGDRNAGFSSANPQKLVLPVVVDPEYHYSSVNVEAQQANPTSLLWWTKRLLALRKQYSAFGRGTMRFLHPDNHRVLAFLREHEEQSILVVANLSRHVQYVELDLSDLDGLTPVELSGHTRFPRIGELPYLLTLGGRSFYWFVLEEDPDAEALARADAYEAPRLQVPCTPDAWHQADNWDWLADALRPFVASRRWYTDAGRRLRDVEMIDALPLPGAERPAAWVMLEAHPAGGTATRWSLPLALAVGEDARQQRHRASHAVVADLTLGDGTDACLFDLLADPPASAPLLAAVRDAGVHDGATGSWLAEASEDLPDAHTAAPRPVADDPGNLCVVYDEGFLLEGYRRLDDGRSLDLELGRFLERRRAAGFDPPVRPLAGSLEQRLHRSHEPVTIAVVHHHVPHETDLRELVTSELCRMLEAALSGEAPEPPAGDGTIVERARAGVPEEEGEPLVGGWLEITRMLGRRVADLHLALCDPAAPAYAPEPHSSFDRRSWYQSLRNRTGTTLRSLARLRRSLDGDLADEADALLNGRDALYTHFAPLLEVHLSADRVRHHGDLRLGTLRFTGNDVVVIDFDGDRSRPLSDRRRKGVALRDVARLVRSLHHAAEDALTDPAVVRAPDRQRARDFLDPWLLWVESAGLRAWLDRAGDAPFVPDDDAEIDLLMDILLLENALGDLRDAVAAEDPAVLRRALAELKPWLAPS